MQKSKSINSFVPTTEHTEYIRGTRSHPQHRSSLDTFVIPGRTRLPSSKSSQNSTDIQVAQALLNHKLLLPSRNPTPIDEMAASGAQSRRMLSREYSFTSSIHDLSPHSAQFGSSVKLGMPLSDGNGSGLLVITPHRRPKTESQVTPHLFVTTTTATDINPVYGTTYDGVNENSEPRNVSRVTSMTWSTVSHRVLSDSSGSSRASRASEFKQEFNKLARIHGVPIITAEFEDDEGNANQTKVTQKSHHHGWLARKFFRRSSSTYTLKAKTTYKPITRKKSFGGIRSVTEDSPTNILSGRSLEEMSRLGGLGILTLPPDFAVDRLTLPTCLSATATYLLKNGCNAPGLFRVSGTASTLNELYQYFDHQFSDAGSPAKVEATVGTGELPSDLEYTLSDVAVLFKKIVINLPGGLLGSVELFETLRNVLIIWVPDPKVSVADPKRVRAKLIAYAIMSISSIHRASLIQAVLGLVAFFGCEADKAQAAERVANEGRPKQDQPSSELMGYQSLGKVLGPLLMGDLNDIIELTKSGETIDNAQNLRKSVELQREHMKKSKKQKRSSIPNKLEKDANLTASVDRANLAAEVMHLLLLNWKEVVKQLRELNGCTSFLQPSKSMTQFKNTPHRIFTRHSTNNSEDNIHVLEILRGRSLPEEFHHFKGPVRVSRKVRITSRSPMARGAIKASEANDESHSRRPNPRDGRTDESPLGSNATDLGIREGASINDTESSTREVSGDTTERRTKSDLAMDEMAMGTILTPHRDSSASSEQKVGHHHGSRAGTPLKRSHTRSSSDAPTTALRIASRTVQRPASIRIVQQPSTDKPLPPISDAQRAESRADSSGERTPPLVLGEESGKLHEKYMSSRLSRRSRASSDTSPFATRPGTPRTLSLNRAPGHWTPTDIPSFPSLEPEITYPPRQSSLPSEQNILSRPIDPLPTFESMEEYKKSLSRKISNSGSAANEGKDKTKHDSTGSVKFLTQKFTEASRTTRNDEQARQAMKGGEIPKVFAYINPIPRPLYRADDPFVSTSKVSLARTPSPEKNTLIPRPVQEVGRGRNARSPHSPTKSSTSPKQRAPTFAQTQVGKRHSIFDIVHDKDAEIVRSNVVGETNINADAQRTVRDPSGSARRILPTRLETSHQSASRDLNASPTRPFSYESFGQSRRAGLESLAIQHERRMSSDCRPFSTSFCEDPVPDKGYLTPSSPSRINTYRNSSDVAKELERQGPDNAAIYQEVIHLRRRLDHSNKEVQATKRSLEAMLEARDAREVKPGEHSPRSSWSKGQISQDLKEANREVNIYKRRAEEAERQLESFKAMTEKVAAKHGVSVDVLLEGVEDGSGEMKGVDVEVLVDRHGEEPEIVAGVFVDEGWGAETLEMSKKELLERKNKELAKREKEELLKREKE